MTYPSLPTTPDFEVTSIAWTIELDNFLSPIHDACFAVFGIKPIDPHQYFVTSGDAVWKAEQLQEDVQNLLADPRATEFAKEGLTKFSKEIDNLIICLKRAKGKFCFLETEWINRSLIAHAKNPRFRDTDVEV